MKESLLFSHQVVNLLSHVHILFRQSLDFFVKVINKTQWMGEEKKRQNEKNKYIKHIILVLFCLGWLTFSAKMCFGCEWAGHKYSCPEERTWIIVFLPLSNLSWR